MVLIGVVKMETRVSKEDLGNENCLTDGVRIGGCDRWQGPLLKKVVIGRDVSCR